jgi:hypothetical protein
MSESDVALSSNFCGYRPIPGYNNTSLFEITTAVLNYSASFNSQNAGKLHVWRVASTTVSFCISLCLYLDED